MGTIYKADYATPTVYSQKDTDGINNIAHLTGDEYIASRSTAGFIKSTDKGVTWGTPFALTESIPFIGIFRMHTTVGGVTAGRLIATRNAINDYAIYVSDDGGLTWARKTASPSDSALRNVSFYQRTDAAYPGSIFCHNCDVKSGSGAVLSYSTNGGETWSSTGGVASGYQRHPQANFIDPWGRLGEVQFSSSASAFYMYYGTYLTTYPIMGFRATISDMTINPSDRQWCADYHFLDALVGVAYTTESGEWAFRYFYPHLPAVISAPQFTSSTGGIIDDIYFCQAMHTMTGKWSVITHNTAGLWQLWISDDMATWNVVFTRDETDVNQGYMTNHVLVD